VSVDIAPGTSDVRIDGLRTAEALRHLLENAGKYSAPGTPIGIRVEPDGKLVRLNIIDQGPGIPAGDQQLIFDKFFRGPAQRHRVAGSGMGLSIAKALIEAQGGQIGVSSSSAGSVFYVILPAASAKQAASAAAKYSE
jgi:signal transduction histidine kinase